MGDIIHTLPALTDAGKFFPDVRFDWVVEEAFAEIPLWHPLVQRVIPMAWRRWRKHIFSVNTWREWRQFYRDLRQEKYDLIIDAQGLIKSALLAFCSRGTRAGLDRHSAWEPVASLCYQRRYAVVPQQHAITRVRELFAAALEYPADINQMPDYNVAPELFKSYPADHPYLVFIHGTTWQTKQWPVEHWVALATLATQAGYNILLPWGNAEEHQRAKRIAAANAKIKILSRADLNELAGIIKGAKIVIAVDTGLGHLAAALSVPTISLYGPTDPKEIGTRGKNQIHLKTAFVCAPCNQQVCNYQPAAAVSPACLAAISVQQVWQRMQTFL